MLDSAPRLGSYEVLALIGVGGMLFVAQPLLCASPDWALSNRVPDQGHSSGLLTNPARTGF